MYSSDKKLDSNFLIPSNNVDILIREEAKFLAEKIFDTDIVSSFDQRINFLLNETKKNENEILNISFLLNEKYEKFLTDLNDKIYTLKNEVSITENSNVDLSKNESFLEFKNFIKKDINNFISFYKQSSKNFFTEIVDSITLIKKDFFELVSLITNDIQLSQNDLLISLEGLSNKDKNQILIKDKIVFDDNVSKFIDIKNKISDLDNNIINLKIDLETKIGNVIDKINDIDSFNNSIKINFTRSLENEDNINILFKNFSELNNNFSFFKKDVASNIDNIYLQLKKISNNQLEDLNNNKLINYIDANNEKFYLKFNDFKKNILYYVEILLDELNDIKNNNNDLKNFEKNMDKLNFNETKIDNLILKLDIFQKNILSNKIIEDYEKNYFKFNSSKNEEKFLSQKLDQFENKIFSDISNLTQGIEEIRTLNLENNIGNISNENLIKFNSKMEFFEKNVFEEFNKLSNEIKKLKENDNTNSNIENNLDKFVSKFIDFKSDILDNFNKISKNIENIKIIENKDYIQNNNLDSILKNNENLYNLTSEFINFKESISNQLTELFQKINDFKFNSFEMNSERIITNEKNINLLSNMFDDFKLSIFNNTDNLIKKAEKIKELNESLSFTKNDINKILNNEKLVKDLSNKFKNFEKNIFENVSILDEKIRSIKSVENIESIDNILNLLENDLSKISINENSINNIQEKFDILLNNVKNISNQNINAINLNEKNINELWSKFSSFENEIIDDIAKLISKAEKIKISEELILNKNLSGNKINNIELNDLYKKFNDFEKNISSDLEKLNEKFNEKSISNDVIDLIEKELNRIPENENKINNLDHNFKNFQESILTNIDDLNNKVNSLKNSNSSIAIKNNNENSLIDNNLSKNFLDLETKTNNEFKEIDKQIDNINENLDQIDILNENLNIDIANIKDELNLFKNEFKNNIDVLSQAILVLVNPDFFNSISAYVEDNKKIYEKFDFFLNNSLDKNKIINLIKSDKDISQFIDDKLFNYFNIINNENLLFREKTIDYFSRINKDLLIQNNNISNQIDSMQKLNNNFLKKQNVEKNSFDNLDDLISIKMIEIVDNNIQFIVDRINKLENKISKSIIECESKNSEIDYKSINVNILNDYKLLEENYRVISTIENLLKDQFLFQKNLDENNKNIVIQLIEEIKINKDSIINIKNKISNSKIANILNDWKIDQETINKINNETYKLIQQATIKLVKNELDNSDVKNKKNYFDKKLKEILTKFNYKESVF